MKRYYVSFSMCYYLKFSDNIKIVANDVHAPTGRAFAMFATSGKGAAMAVKVNKAGIATPDFDLIIVNETFGRRSAITARLTSQS